MYFYGQIISVCNSERIIKIGQCLRKLCSNEKGSSFLTHNVYRLSISNLAIANMSQSASFKITNKGIFHEILN